MSRPRRERTREENVVTTRSSSAGCVFKLDDCRGPLVAIFLKAEIDCPFDTRFALLRMRGLNGETCSSNFTP
jgi:hypothetical protein